MASFELNNIIIAYVAVAPAVDYARLVKYFLD